MKKGQMRRGGLMFLSRVYVPGYQLELAERSW